MSLPGGYTYTFPALRGKQANRPYYVAMCPLKLLPRIFLFDEAEIPAQLRAQRVLNTARIPEIARYLLDNRNDYAFSAITASIDGDINFLPSMLNGEELDIGSLVVPMTAKFVINDGQHRRAAIEAALKEQPDLGEETIAVVFYLDTGLTRSQQLFADLNKHAVRPTKSISVLYDNRAPLAALARDLADKILCFRGLTDFENTTLSNRTIKLFTLSGIYQATAALLGKRQEDPVTQDEATQAHDFWCELCRVIPQWRLAAEQKVHSSELRQDYVNVHTVLLNALGLAGRALIQQYPAEWRSRLSLLGNLDWARSNTELWEGTAMIGGQMSRTRQNVMLTAEILKRTLGVGDITSPDAALIILDELQETPSSDQGPTTRKNKSRSPRK